MSRYIDAEWLKAEFPHNEDWNYPVNTNSYVVEMIDEAPRIDIVRCKECKHWLNHKYADYDQNDFVYYCAVHKVSFSGKDFCSYGEREGE